MSAIVNVLGRCEWRKPAFSGRMLPEVDKVERIVIYTDGGCSGNPGPGAWAYVLLRDGERFEASGAEPDTTNNRMELSAVIMALERLVGDPGLRKVPVELHTDSQYVQLGMTRWIAGWVRNGWKNASGDPVKNQDLWRRLQGTAEGLAITWHWVKGHEGDELNERCDELVQAAIAASRAAEPR